MKRIIFLISVFVITIIGVHTNWIENLFKLNYCVGGLMGDFLLFCILVVLSKKK